MLPDRMTTLSPGRSSLPPAASAKPSSGPGMPISVINRSAVIAVFSSRKAFVEFAAWNTA